ncbi:MAG: hypothetical protein PHG99_06025 [Erysipelotrichaceae bacterium]|nr:hypothetical protein [Erysipelotrichaceae bacterium]
MIAKIMRVLTLPPIVTGFTIVFLYSTHNDISVVELYVLFGCLVVFPLLAYPFREVFKIGNDRRQGQRSVAMVFSVISYSYGYIWSLISNASMITKVFFSSYLISVIALLIINKIFKYHASGHACSTTAPLVLLGWQLGFWYMIIGMIFVGIVYFASLRLKRHTLLQLISGSSISVLAGFLSIIIYV